MACAEAMDGLVWPVLETLERFPAGGDKVSGPSQVKITGVIASAAKQSIIGGQRLPRPAMQASQ